MHLEYSQLLFIAMDYRIGFMARFARVVAPGIPHHVPQRGNRRQTTFFEESDYQLYLELALEWFKHHGARVWAYCLMPNHVHLIVVPEHEQSLSKAIGEVHQLSGNSEANSSQCFLN